MKQAKSMIYVPKKMERESTLFDVDEVIIKNQFLKAVNKFTGKNYKPEDFTGYFIEEEAFSSKEELEEYKRFLRGYNIYQDAVIEPECYEALKELSKVQDVYILSSCLVYGMERESGRFFADKFNCLMENFPFLDPHHVIFSCEKNRLSHFTNQVDDLSKNLKNEIPHRILFTAHHNQNIPFKKLIKEEIVRINNWPQLYQRLLRYYTKEELRNIVTTVLENLSLSHIEVGEILQIENDYLIITLRKSKGLSKKEIKRIKKGIYISTGKVSEIYFI